jgi:hypothetical protein
MKIDWDKYALVKENISAVNGGGFLYYYEEFGYAVYGAGDTVQETEQSLAESKSAYEQFGFDCVPEPKKTMISRSSATMHYSL